jgi:hypothetical protein
VKDRFEISGLGFEVKTKIEIFSVIGKSLYKSQLLSQPQTSNPPKDGSAMADLQLQTIVDVSALPSGIYFVRIENEKDTWNGRFVKQ